jgi:gliding motility-associated-like protein
MEKYLKILFFVNLLIIHFSFAQEADDYAYTTNKTSSLITLPNPIPVIRAGATNVASAVIPLGFEFWFMGIRYTSFSLNANGAIQLGSQPILSGGNAYTINNAARIIAFASGDVDPNTNIVLGNWRVSNNGGVIQYQILGSTPNRTLVIECKNLNVNFQSTTNDATFQIVLYETAPLPNASNRGGRIEFRYANIRTTVETSSLRIGFGIGTGNNQAKGVDLSADPPTASITTSGIENRIPNGVIGVLDGSNDGNRRIFSFESPYPDRQATNLTSVCALVEGGIKLDWENSSTNAVGSVLYRSTDGANFSFLTQTPKGTNTFIDKNISTGTSYIYRVYAVTEGKLAELHPTGEFKTGEEKTINITGKPVICNGVAEVEAESGYDLYEWFDSGGNRVASSENPKVTLTEGGKYTVKARQEILNCTANGEITITECCAPILVVPNAFTPHNTPANNIFRVKHENLLKFRMRIYNRWGVLVFETEDPEDGWNGYFQGSPAQADAYQVIIEYTGCEDGKTIRGKKQEVLNLLE